MSRRAPRFAKYFSMLFSISLVACDRGVDTSPASSASEQTASEEGETAQASPHGDDPHGGRPPMPNDAIHGGGAMGGTAAPAPAVELPPAPPFDAAHPNVGGVTWTAPSGFAYRQPAVAMRLAEYVVGRAGDADVVMTVFHFPGMGGSVDSNIQRWIGQFTQPDGRSTLSVATIGTEEVNGLRVTTVDVGGTYAEGSMGGGSGENQRLLGAIVESPAGPIFFKLVGPRATIGTVEPGFRRLIASFAPAPTAAP